jgi:hypothetical protein
MEKTISESLIFYQQEILQLIISNFKEDSGNSDPLGYGLLSILIFFIPFALG